MPVTSSIIGQHKNQDVHRFTITNKNGLKAVIMSFGATFMEMHVPDNKGAFADVLMGFDDLAGYQSQVNPYFGATVGRCAGRIANGSFALNGQKYQLLQNNGANHLHGGGENSLSWKVWNADVISDQSVRFYVLSPDGEEGYPGNLKISVTYTLNDNDELRFDSRAESDADTILNITNHAYWNLAGHDCGSVENHLMKIQAANCLAMDETQIPTGDYVDLTDNILDYRYEKSVSESMNKNAEYSFAGGLDHTFVLAKIENALSFAASCTEPVSGRSMEVLTTEPSIHIYSANFVEGVQGKGASINNKQESICFETQNFPDAINHSNFPSPLLKKGKTYKSSTVYRFSVK